MRSAQRPARGCRISACMPIALPVARPASAQTTSRHILVRPAQAPADSRTELQRLQQAVLIRGPAISVPRTVLETLFPTRSATTQLAPRWQERWWAAEPSALRKHYRAFHLQLAFEVDGQLLDRCTLAELRFYPGRRAVRLYHHYSYDILENRTLLGWRKDDASRLVAVLTSTPDAAPLPAPGAPPPHLPCRSRRAQRLAALAIPAATNATATRRASVDEWIADLPYADPPQAPGSSTAARGAGLPAHSAGGGDSLLWPLTPAAVREYAMRTSRGVGGWTDAVFGLHTPSTSEVLARASERDALGVTALVPGVPALPHNEEEGHEPSSADEGSQETESASPEPSALPGHSTSAQPAVIVTQAVDQQASELQSGHLMYGMAIQQRATGPRGPAPPAQHTPPPPPLPPASLAPHPSTTPAHLQASQPAAQQGHTGRSAGALKRTYVPARVRPIMNEVYVPFGFWRDLFDGADRPFPINGLALRVAITGAVRMAAQPALLVRRATPYGYYVLRGLRGLQRLKGKVMVRWNLLLNGEIELETSQPAPTPATVPIPSTAPASPTPLPPSPPARVGGGGNIVPLSGLKRAAGAVPGASSIPRAATPAAAAAAPPLVSPSRSVSPSPVAPFYPPTNQPPPPPGPAAYPPAQHDLN